MHRARTGSALAAALIAAALAVVSAAPPAAKFSVAVLRRDGLLIPFASFNGHEWTAPWPSGGDIPLPIGLADIPKQWWGAAGPGAKWTAWLADDELKPLSLLKPVHVPIFCTAHLAVATDYRGAAPSEREPTVPKDGIATAGDVSIKPITQVSVNAPDAALIVQAITEKFNEEETLAATHFTQWAHPFGRSSRAEFPIVLESFYRATEQWAKGQIRTTYVEAVRRYPALSSDRGCGLLTYARGWITEVPGKKPVINLGARVTYCDRADVTFMQPFGRVVLTEPGERGTTTAPEVYWIYQLSSWRDELYSVARVDQNGVRPVVVVSGGACAKEKEKDAGR